jgi:hypothetical protein
MKKKTMAPSSSQAEKRKKTHTQKQNAKKKEGTYFSSLTSTFGMKHSSCLLFFTFLQC